jgi:REP element-mobilizing transposase RayT
LSNNDPPRRRNSQRYPGYDYSQPGAVFVTLCTHHRQRLFGRIVDGQMMPSPAGAEFEDIWRDLPDRFPDIVLDAFALMPDHLHAILFIGTNPLIESDRGSSLSDVMKWYKVKTQATYSRRVREGSWPRYERHLWQRDYHDRIIRNDYELERIRVYIEGNPGRWQERQDALKGGSMP